MTRESVNCNKVYIVWIPIEGIQNSIQREEKLMSKEKKGYRKNIMEL